MSQENVEIVRRMYDAYAEGDFATTLSYFDPEVAFSQPALEPGAGTFYGHEGMGHAMDKWTGAWTDYRVQVEDLTDLGEHVLAATRHHGRGKHSGVQVDQRIFQVLTLRNGKIVQLRMYYGRADALKAVGLEE
jgi:ketosteroid isomerase-like protein